MPEIPFDQITSVRVRQFDAYWRRKKGSSIAPDRADIDPAEITRLLPYLLIVDIEHAPFRIRYRLCGTMIQRHDEELTGKYLDELTNTPAEAQEEITRFYRRVVDEVQPHFSVHTFPSRSLSVPLLVQGGIWPLAGAGGRIDQCMGIQDYPDM
jgi:hypothetical protein